MRSLGSAYMLQDEMTPTLSTVTTIEAQRGIVSLHVQAEGTWAGREARTAYAADHHCQVETEHDA
jgi:hypothetical protein